MGTCDNCPWGGIRCGTRGDPKAPLVIVGESPGLQEIRQKKPFVGPSGDILHSVLPRDVPAFITNALCCKPPKNKTPAKVQRAILSCHDRLMDEIKAHPRKLIIALGGPAAQALTGNYNLKITQVRGQVIESPLAEYGIALAVHPAFLMRGGGSYKQWKVDIERALELLNNGKIDHLWREPHVHHIMCKEDAWAFLEKCTRNIAADIETSGFNPKTDQILSIGFATEENPTEVYVMDNRLDLTDPDLDAIALAKIVLERGREMGFKFTWHNGKFDIGFLRAAGIKAWVDDDTMLLSYALNEHGGMHDLEQVMGDHLGAPNYKYMVKPYLPNQKSSYELIPPLTLHEYQSKDVCGTAMSLTVLREEVAKDEALDKLYTKVLVPASELLANVEARGLYVDDERVAENEVALAQDLEEKRAELHEIAGWAINPNSPQQVAQLLYTQLRLRGKGRGTAKEILRDIKHPAAQKVLEFRRISKALGTYVRGVISHKDADNRIRATYLIHGTTTGRLASRQPNLQNIPRDPRIKGQFIAAPGNVLLEADYSQAELRSLAILSGDPALCDIYLSTDRSLHKEVALDRFGPNYTADQYIRAKAVNFGIVYGRSAQSLADEFHYPVGEAQNDIDAWFKQFPIAREFIKTCRLAPIRRQVMTTCFGRKRRFRLVSRDTLNHMQNEAANFPHQSIASDCTLTSAIELDPILSVRGANIVNLVHDSILVELPNDPALIEWTKTTMNEVMVRKPIEWGLKRVPFKVDFKIGTRWGSLEEQK